MDTRSWWNRHGSQLALLALAVLTALWVRQTQGGTLFEIYYWISRPFQADPEELVERQAQIEAADPRIQKLEAENRELRQENETLRELLGYVSSKPDRPAIVAPVIARGADHWWQQVTLGRGSDAGIRKDALVVGPGGLAGRIVAVTPRTSKVLLLSDPSSQIGVAVTRSRQMGYLRGDEGNRGVLALFNTVPDVKPGDVVATSAFSQIVPPGWPVGKVVSVDINKATGPEAIVEFFTPLDTLEWVAIYPNEQQASESPDETSD